MILTGGRTSEPGPCDLRPDSDPNAAAHHTCWVRDRVDGEKGDVRCGAGARTVYHGGPRGAANRPAMARGGSPRTSYQAQPLEVEDHVDGEGDLIVLSQAVEEVLSGI